MYTGIKYHAITHDKLHDKWVYDPERRPRAGRAARRALPRQPREAGARRSRRGMDRPPIVVSPYDAELYGHWWYEGPLFLNDLFRQLHFDQNDRRADHARRLPGAPPHQPGGHAVRLLVGRSRATASTGATRPTPGSTGTARGRRADGGARAPQPARRGLERARAQPGGARAAAGAVERLAVHHDAPARTVSYATRRFNEHTIRFTRLYEELQAGQARRGVRCRTSRRRTTSSPTSTTASTRPDASGLSAMPEAAALKVLFVASEAAPFAKTGGLGDVAGALPKALRRPRHRRARGDAALRRHRLERAGAAGRARSTCPCGGARRARASGSGGCRAATCRSTSSSTTATSIAPYLYGPPGEGYDDNLERFTFLSRGALELCKALGFQPGRHPRERLADRARAGLREHGRVGAGRSTAPPPSTPSTTWPTRA